MYLVQVGAIGCASAPCSSVMHGVNSASSEGVLRPLFTMIRPHDGGRSTHALLLDSHISPDKPHGQRQRPTLVRCPRGTHAACLRRVAGQAWKPSSSLAQQFATRHTSQDRDQITQGIEDDFLTQKTAAEPEMSCHAAFSTSSSNDDALGIDPQLLRLDREHHAVASPFRMKLINTAGDSLGFTSRSSDETAAGHR
jgi:hypothetical protein